MLLTADLHLTDRSVDAYRWDVFRVLQKVVAERKVRRIFILGDLTDAKDRHSAVLVNRVVDSIKQLVASRCEVHILTGNHDYVDEECPYFRFLKHVPGVYFYMEPTMLKDEGVLLIPHRKHFVIDDALDGMLRRATLVLLHQTLSGASVGSTVLDGVSPKVLSRYKVTMLSGDVHVPQTVGPVEYVGAPYHVHFGDSFRPRLVHVRRSVGGGWSVSEVDTDKEFPRRHSFVVEDEKFEPTIRRGDQVKLRIVVTQDNLPTWQELRRWAVKKVTDAGGVVCGVSVDASRLRSVVPSSASRHRLNMQSLAPEDLLARYCKAKQIGEHLLAMGLRIVKDETAHRATGD